MKSVYTIIFKGPILTVLCFITLFVQGQKVDLFNVVPETLGLPKEHHELNDQISAFTIMKPNRKALIEIERLKPQNLSFDVFVNNKILTVKLHRSNPFSENIVFAEASFNGIERINYETQLHYQGEVDGIDHSIAAVSINNGQISGVFSDGEGNINLNPVHPSDNKDSLHISFRTKDITAKQLPWDCQALNVDDRLDSSILNTPTFSTQIAGTVNAVGCPVDIYFEADNSIYKYWGSSQKAIDYIAAFFNVVQQLYKNENIKVQISEIKVWSSTDPYVSATNTNTALSIFSSRMANGFNGDLAHLISQRNLGGGLAYVNVLCRTSSQVKTGVSEIYSTFKDFPNYSWTTQVITHELGHNLGSPHTHSCTWPGGAIDNCYTTEGGCASGPQPVNGGTIMSYCHLTSMGINFNNGFGTLPGNLIRSKVAGANCLCSCNSMEVTVAAVDVTCDKKGSATAQVSGGVPPYIYKWSTGETTQSINNLTAGNYNVLVSDQTNNCQVYQSVTVRNSGLDATITPVGTVKVCVNSTELSVVKTGTGYTYQWYKGNEPISGATSSTYIARASGDYSVRVSLGNCNATSPVTHIELLNLEFPDIIASGPTTFCAGGSVTFRTTPKPGYTYGWFLNGSQITGATSTSFTATKGGNYSVIGSYNNCHMSTLPTLVTVVPYPGASLTATSSTTFCEGGNVTLNAVPQSNYSYVWKKDGGVISNANQADLIVNSSGSYTVQITNQGCTSNSNAISVTAKPNPAITVTAAGNTSFCSGGNVILSSSTSPGYQHQWLKDGINISGATSPNLKITTQGSYSVRNFLNGCAATSTASAITVYPLPTVSIQPKTATLVKGRNLTLTLSGAPHYNFDQQQYVNAASANRIIVSPPQTMTYVITGTSVNGCSSADSSYITVEGCGDVKNMKAEVYSPTRALLQWENPEGVMDDSLEYKLSEEVKWNKIYVKGNTVMLSNLKPNSNYDFRVTSLCTYSKRFFYADTGYFKTKGIEGEVYFNVFPNPALREFNLEILVQQSSRVQVELYTVTGQKVITIVPENKLENGYLLKQVTLPGLSNGVYIVQLIVNEKVYSKKLVIYR